MNWKKLFSALSGIGHMKGMAIIMGGTFVVLLAFGQPVSAAIVYSLVLSCPLMMIGMMFGGHEGHGHEGHGADGRPAQSPQVLKSAAAGRKPVGPHDHH